MDEALAQEAISLLGTAAAMLIEDAHPLLVTRPANKDECGQVARAPGHLGSDLTALAGAAEVLARMRSDVTDRL